MRTWLFALPVALVFWLAGATVDPWAGYLGIAAGVFPLAWSLVALAWPGTGRWWRWRTGGREPSPRERETFDDALADVIEPGAGVRAPRGWFVLDSAEPAAAVRGRTVMLTRALLAMPGALSGVLAHELAHANTPDGRLTEALNRLVLWPGALLPPGGLVRGVLRAALFVAGGGLSLRVLGAAWGGYWRGREYAADSYAADLGAGDDLARFLEQHALFFDVPIPYLWLTEHAHPPTELRLGRLASAQEAL